MNRADISAFAKCERDRAEQLRYIRCHPNLTASAIARLRAKASKLYRVRVQKIMERHPIPELKQLALGAPPRTDYAAAILGALTNRVRNEICRRATI